MPKENPFIFDDGDVKGCILADLKLLHRMRDSFDYVHSKLRKLGCHVEGRLPKPTPEHFNEGKNYSWVALTSYTVRMLIRAYGSHFTVYAQRDTPGWFPRCSAFMYSVDTKKITIKDKIRGFPRPGDMLDIEGYYNGALYGNPALCFNTHLSMILKAIRKDDVHSLWNDYAYKRQHFVKIQNIYDGESIVSIDRLVFCAEELSTQHICLAAENEVLEAIKKYKKGDIFSTDRRGHNKVIARWYADEVLK